MSRDPGVSYLCTSSRYEDYVDQHYKEFLKNQGKVDSVRLSVLGGRRQGDATRASEVVELLPSMYEALGSVPSATKTRGKARFLKRR